MRDTFIFIFILIVMVSGPLAGESEKVWIFFADKGPRLQKKEWNRLENSLTSRTRARRAKVTPAGELLVDRTDRPVYQPYIDALNKKELEPVVVSKWLNAVSVYITPGQKQDLESLGFVKTIQPVLSGRRQPVIKDQLYKSETTSYEYGPSLVQNELINIPNVHNMGLTGRGILIGVFDSGFKTDLAAFEHLNIVKTWDFIYDDPIVEDEDVDLPSQHNHGTSVLSLIAGYHEKHLIAPAFEASFLLAKTEDRKSETQIEEDYWIEAAEWAEQLGADIITTSLGYIDWYTPSDADGETAPITRAADLAVKKGVIVVASAGNEGDGDDAWGIITPPADGDSVIAVGAVGPDSMITHFSSRGPAADGRIKPDVVAMGSNCVIANADGTYSLFGRGTSYAAPQVAATAALVLQAHPELTPMQVRQALIMTANRFTRPDNIYGYGLINALKAVNFFGPVEGLPDNSNFVKLYPNPFQRSRHQVINFMINAKEQMPITIKIYNILGQKIDSIHEEAILGKEQILMWAPEQKLASGIYLYHIKLGRQTYTGKFTLFR